MPDKTPWAKLGKGRSEAAVAKILATGTVAEYPTTADADGSELAVHFH